MRRTASPRVRGQCVASRISEAISCPFPERGSKGGGLLLYASSGKRCKHNECVKEVRESMAITRRQFVTRLGALAAAMGMSQADLSKVAEVFAHSAPWNSSWAAKPKVVWVHGAECTGDSTSLLSLFEDVNAKAIEGRSETILAALDLAVGGDGTGATVADVDTAPGATHPYGHRTLVNTKAVVGCNFEEDTIATIADVLIDFIDLQYHETVMGMGGDMAYQWLKQLMNDGLGAKASAPFVLVVEGSVQPSDKNGYWNEGGATPWCSIGMSEAGAELPFDEAVLRLASHDKCVAVIPIGQCAAFGGYPACSSPVLSQDANGKLRGGNMTGAMGVHAYLGEYASAAVANKVINVPGCPTNPWWFVLTVVAWLVDFVAVNGTTNTNGTLGILSTNGSGAVSINASAVDHSRRLKAVYGIPLHGPYCKRYQHALNGVFAQKPGDTGCLQLIGCKGPAVGTLCGPHGWNAQNPRNYAVNPNADYGVAGVNGTKGGNCVAGGHPCMACTEPGYPDAFLPFVVR